jgi:hypothetical protein
VVEGSLDCDELHVLVDAADTKATLGGELDEALVTPAAAPLVLGIPVGGLDGDNAAWSCGGCGGGSAALSGAAVVDTAISAG